MSKEERWLIATLAAIQFTNVMDFMIVMPLGPQLMRQMNVTAEKFGFMVSAYMMSAGIFGFLGSFFIDRFDRKKFLIFIYSGFLVGTLGCGLINENFDLLIAARIFTGFFGGLLGSVIFSVVSDVIPFERRGTAMGLVMAAFSLASVLGVPAGLFLAHHYTWQTPFYAIVVLGLGVLISIFYHIPSLTGHLLSKADRPNPLDTFASFLTTRNTQIALGMMIMLMVGQFVVVPFINPFMQFNVGMRPEDATYIYLLGGLASIVSGPLVGKLSDKVGKKPVFLVFNILTMVPVLLLTNIAPGSSLWVILSITTLFFIIIGARVGPAMTMVTGSVNPAKRGAFLSLSGSMQQMSAGTASFIASKFIGEGAGRQLLHYNWMGYISVISIAIVTILAYKLVVAGDSPKQSPQESAALEI